MNIEEKNPANMPTRSGKEKVRIELTLYTSDMTHTQPTAMTVETVVLIERDIDWLTEMLTRSL